MGLIHEMKMGRRLEKSGSREETVDHGDSEEDPDQKPSTVTGDRSRRLGSRSVVSDHWTLSPRCIRAYDRQGGLRLSKFVKTGEQEKPIVR